MQPCFCKGDKGLAGQPGIPGLQGAEGFPGDLGIELCIENFEKS